MTHLDHGLMLLLCYRNFNPVFLRTLICPAAPAAAAADQIHTGLPILLQSHTSATHLLLLLTRFTLDYLYFCSHTQVPHTCCCCWPDSQWITYTFAIIHECHVLAAADQIHTGLSILLQSHMSTTHFLLLTRFTLDYLYVCSHTRVPSTCVCPLILLFIIRIIRFHVGVYL